MRETPCSLKVIGGKGHQEDRMKLARVSPAHEIINSPSHYVEGRKIQPIEVLEDWNLNHHLACALKYISRAGRKHDEVKDLRKCIWYV
jgi:hypothetical protein